MLIITLGVTDIILNTADGHPCFFFHIIYTTHNTTVESQQENRIQGPAYCFLLDFNQIHWDIDTVDGKRWNPFPENSSSSDNGTCNTLGRTVLSK